MTGVWEFDPAPAMPDVLDRAGKYYLVEEPHSLFDYAIYHDDGRRIFHIVNEHQGRVMLTRLSTPRHLLKEEE